MQACFTFSSVFQLFFGRTGITRLPPTPTPANDLHAVALLGMKRDRPARAPDEICFRCAETTKPVFAMPLLITRKCRRLSGALARRSVVVDLTVRHRPPVPAPSRSNAGACNRPPLLTDARSRHRRRRVGLAARRGARPRSGRHQRVVKPPSRKWLRQTISSARDMRQAFANRVDEGMAGVVKTSAR